VTVDEATTAQTSEPALIEGAAVAVTDEEAEGDAVPADLAGAFEEQAARSGTRSATRAAARPLRGRRDRIDTTLADLRGSRAPCQLARVPRSGELSVPGTAFSPNLSARPPSLL
jgi:hypothetical protein